MTVIFTSSEKDSSITEPKMMFASSWAASATVFTFYPSTLLSKFYCFLYYFLGMLL